ncbi:unnamed protein product [Fusarium equiseti]|uniref:Nucleoside phosphorylase domain-containing protein n=1 Tax=Fusarium equiseti TaxID=61235 RepID=A0A8J2NM79_FUSEQ|nr:unnamed protein product [Fusarium equiseti]
MSNPMKYTVGWICALQSEYVAAQLFLDEIHPGPSSVGLVDENIYTLGRMGNHNVVITVLPSSGRGTVNAATTAVFLRRSFYNIQVTLMVGTAGGAPSDKNDIRLGDVVVGVPGRGHTGVFQYDFGKALQDREFLNTRVLNPPPEILLQAASRLQAHHRKNGHQLQQYIDTVLLAHPKLRKGGYERPKNSSDRLYLPQVIHPANHGFSCAKTCGNNPAKLVQRAPRTGKDGELSVHYGLIASGDSFIDNATFRDKIVAKNGVLCFEMEAAGLMNALPCLAIRGISNYADSHVNKEWEGYAAMTAAAYAKDLLQCVPKFDVDTARKLEGYRRKC